MGTITQTPIEQLRANHFGAQNGSNMKPVEYVDRHTALEGPICGEVSEEELLQRIDGLQSGKETPFRAPEGHSVADFARYLAYLANRVYFAPTAVVHAAHVIDDPAALSRLSRSDTLLAFVSHEDVSTARRADLEAMLGHATTPVLVNVLPAE